MIEHAALEADEWNKGGYIPLRFFVDFLRFLKSQPDTIQIITYDDLDWGEDFDFRGGFKQEYRNWKSSLERGERDPNKIYVLLQHDADSRAERTMRVVREEERLGVASNVMIFAERVNRKRLRTEGELGYTEYPLDHDVLRRLQDKHGFVVGYHCNAYEKSLFQLDRARDVFLEDLAKLRRDFQVRYFSAHGGVPGPDGRNNRDLELPESVTSEIRWVHNGGSPFFDATFSDGGLNSPHRDPNKRDLRDFVRSWRAGRRYRVLTHPQYYTEPHRRSPRLSGAPWYEEVCRFYSEGSDQSIWDAVELKTSALDLRPSRQNARRWLGMLRRRL